MPADWKDHIRPIASDDGNDVATLALDSHSVVLMLVNWRNDDGGRPWELTVTLNAFRSQKLSAPSLPEAKSEAISLVRARLVEALAAVGGAIEAGKPRVPRGHCGRCDRCGWLIGDKNCTPQNCSTRPMLPRREVCAGCGLPFEDDGARKAEDR